MNYDLEHWLGLIARFAPNQYLQALLITVVFVLLAKIADLIMSRFLKRLLKKTEITLDEEILAIFELSGIFF